MEKFFDYVKQMREAQKEYFKTRSKTALQRSIMLEKIVDKEVEDYFKPKIKTPQELNLF